MADTLPSELVKVDPRDAWAPFRPNAAVPWNEKWVAHLHRRAAFGSTPFDATRSLRDGYEKTLERLLGGEPDADELLDVLLKTGQFLTTDTQLRVWWLTAMLEGKHPLREKMTLFWHNHFATSYAKVQRTRLMFEQNLQLRKHALGRFRPFLLEMSLDTAMLKWLDSNQNVKGAPNENFAREVMELFSLGVGHYTEKDIQEAARAFTGWHVDSRIDEDEDSFQFKPTLHDDGAKTVFGRTGNWNGTDILSFCCDKPECAAFLVGKLYSFFVSETKPPATLIEPLAERLRKSDYDFADLVKTMLGSRLFFSEHAYRKRVKWPVEYALGAIRAAAPGRVPLGDVLDPLAKMGQVLFAPPNVKGWRTGTDWLNSATLLARNNFAETLAMGAWERGRDDGVPQRASVAVSDTATATPVDFPAASLAEYSMAGSAAVAGSAVAMTFPTFPDPNGKLYVAPALQTPPPPGSGTIDPPPQKPPAAGSAGVQPLPKALNPGEVPPPTPEPRFDVSAPLLQPKPKDAAELVARMSVALAGETAPASVKSRIERYLLDGKPAPKELDTPAFRQKVRETLHAMMCLPEYQLN